MLWEAITWISINQTATWIALLARSDCFIGHGVGRAEEKMGEETSHCPSETCDARNPPKILRREHGQSQTAVLLATSFALLVHHG